MNHKIDLSPFGLSEKESKVYVALLELGSGTSLLVGKKAGIPKSTTHDVLLELGKRGLASSYTQKNRKVFTAENPDKLREKVRTQEELLKTLLPELHAINNFLTHKPKVRFYEDKVGIETALEELLKEAKELIFMGNADAGFRAFPEYFPSATQQRIARKIITRGFSVDGLEARKMRSADTQSFRRTKIIQSPEKITPLAWIWNDKFAIFNTVGSPSVLIIEDHEVVTFLRAMFCLVWEHSPEVS